MKDAYYRTQSAQVTISPEFTFCDDCNHIMRGLLESCTSCGSENVYGETRVVGYFSNVQNWEASDQGGGSWIIDPDGEVLGLTTADEPFLTLDLDLALADLAKKTYPRYVAD